MSAQPHPQPDVDPSARLKTARAPGATKVVVVDVKPFKVSTTTTFPGRRRERARALRRALRERGVWQPAPLVHGVDPDAVEGAIRWYDDVRSRRSEVTAAALVGVLRDGGMPGYGTTSAGEPCPLTGPDREPLREAWKALDARLSRTIGQWQLWRDGVHLHALGGEFVIACPAAAHSWLSERYGRVIAQAAVVPVRFTVCEEGGAQ